MIEMHSKYDNMHKNGMFYAFFALIIMYYRVKIACYQYYEDYPLVQRAQNLMM